MDDERITGTDLAIPQRDVGKLPSISAEAYQHVGRFAGALVMSCFEQMGGLPRMVTWADGNPTDFYTKLFPKMIQRSQQVDVTGSITLDDAISRIQSTSEPIDATFEEVSPEQDYDL